MIRTVMALAGVLLIGASLIVIVPILILPNTFLHQFVPFLAPLHQAMACTSDETMRYDTRDFADGFDTRFFCVNDAGQEREVTAELERPANISLVTLCLGGLLWLVPLIMTVRRGMRGEHGAETQAALQQSFSMARRGISDLQTGGAAASADEGMNASSAVDASLSHNTPPLNESGTQQLAALDKMLQQGTINQSSYDIARASIIKDYAKKEKKPR